MRAALVAILGPRPAPPAGPSDAAFWAQIDAAGRDGWELGRPAPPIARWLAGRQVAGQRVPVVGCGRGHEARLFARAGARVVAVDLAEQAVVDARA